MSTIRGNNKLCLKFDDKITGRSIVAYRKTDFRCRDKCRSRLNQIVFYSPSRSILSTRQRTCVVNRLYYRYSLFEYTINVLCK